MPTETLVKIPCITLWRPWAQWVALGVKPIETRLHDRFRGLKGRRIAIHAGQKWDASAITAAAPYGVSIFRSNNYAGRVVCTAFVSDARWLTAADSPSALIDCGSVRRFGLVLTDVRMIDDVDMPGVAGRQGQFSVEVPERYAL